MRKQEGLISAVLPTYNRADYWLPKSIEGVLLQTYPAFELIIVDDGSSDSTEHVVASFRDARIRYLRVNENSASVSIPRNIGIVSANGEYLAHVDDDTVSFPCRFEVLITALRDSPEYFVAYGNRNCEGICYKCIGYNPEHGPGLDTSQFLYRACVYDHMPLVFCRNQCDWEILRGIWKLRKSFLHVDALVCEYIWHGSNRTLDQCKRNRPIVPTNFAEFFLPHRDRFKFSLTAV